MVLVILNDQLALFVVRDIINNLTNALNSEIQKIYVGNGTPSEVAAITSEITNIARQVDEELRGYQAKSRGNH